MPLALLAGVIVGAVGAWWILDTDATPTMVQATPDPAVSGSPAAVVSKVATTAPVTFADLEKIRSDFEQTYALYQLMDGQDAAGIEGLLDQAKSELSGDDYVAASAILYGRLAELDPQRAVERVLLAPGTAQSSWLSAVFHSWARLDLDAALAAAQQLSGPFKQIAGRAVLRSRGDLSGVVRSDIAGELALQSPPLTRGSDFSQAWQEAIARPNRNQQAQGLMQIAALWASTDPAAAMTATEAIAASGLRQSIQGRIAMEWARQDPDAAFEWVRNQSDSAQSSRIVQQVFQVLAQTDPQQAYARAQQLGGSMSTRAMLGVIGPLAVVDRQAAAQWLEAQQSPTLRMEAIQTMAVSLGQHAPDAAADWIDTLPENDAYMADMMLSAILINVDPDRAARRVAQMDDPQRRQNAASNLISNWASNDVKAAADWITTMPQAEQGSLYQVLAAQWSQFDSAAALQFVTRLDSDAHKDHVRLGVISSGGPLDQAERLIGDIQDPQLKQQAGMQLYYRILQYDSEQAERFRADIGLDLQNMGGQGAIVELGNGSGE